MTTAAGCGCYVLGQRMSGISVDVRMPHQLLRCDDAIVCRKVSTGHFPGLTARVSAGMGLKQFVRNIVYDHASIRGIWLHSQKIKRRFLYLRNYGISDWFFDKWNGIETAAVIPGELNLDRPAIATDYLPVRPRVLLRALSSLKIDYPKYVFIDVGSGKGRGVFLASRFPFRKLIGVEIAKALQAKAQKNLKVWHTDDPGRIEFVWMNP